MQQSAMTAMTPDGDGPERGWLNARRPGTQPRWLRALRLAGSTRFALAVIALLAAGVLWAYHAPGWATWAMAATLSGGTGSSNQRGS